MARLSVLAALFLTAAAWGLQAWDQPHGLAMRPAADGAVIESGFFRSGYAGNGDLLVAVAGPLRLTIDGRVVLERSGGEAAAVASAAFAFDTTQHLVELSHAAGVTPEWRWRAAAAHVPRPIDASAFSPETMRPLRWRLRGLRPWVGGLAALAWTALLILSAWRWFERRLPGTPVPVRGPMAVVLAVAVVLMSAGVWWAWPTVPWAPDELWPETVRRGLAMRFSGGWFDLYPPGHFYVLAAAYAPALSFAWTGLMPLDAGSADALLQLIGRGVSLGMAVGILLLVARLARDLGGPAQAWPAAVCAASALPFVFYTRLANVDVPYLFWFCASLVFFRAAVEEARLRDVAGFAVTGMFAVVTKDQAYALYVLPAAWLGMQVWRRDGGARVLLTSALLAGVTFVAGHNLPLNLDGFRAHLASITGGGSETYRMVPASAGGLIELGGIVAGQLWWALGVPGVVLLAAALWRPSAAGWIPGWIWLFPVSYVATFIAVVGYSYDRFVLPVTLVCGLVAGAGLRRLLTAGEASRPARWAARICVGWLVWRVVSVDVLVLRDSRYQAESWLSASVATGELVATVWQAGYLPRLDGFNHREIAPTEEATMAAAPAYIVVNSEFVHRYPADAPMARWFRWLESAGSPYVEAWRWKDPLHGTELAWWPSFTDRLESVSTNLDKVNPEIVVFRRK